MSEQRLDQKAGERRSRIGIFGGTKSPTGRRSQKGKVFNRRNKSAPTNAASKPSTSSGTQFPKGAVTQTINGVTTLVEFGSDDDDE